MSNRMSLIESTLYFTAKCVNLYKIKANLIKKPTTGISTSSKNFSDSSARESLEFLTFIRLHSRRPTTDSTDCGTESFVRHIVEEKAIAFYELLCTSSMGFHELVIVTCEQGQIVKIHPRIAQILFSEINFRFLFKLEQSSKSNKSWKFRKFS